VLGAGVSVPIGDLTPALLATDAGDGRRRDAADAREDIADITAGYGLVVVDECHHIPAAAFENVGTRPRFVHYSKRSRGDSTRRPAARSTY
jgi:hypothetical protein